MRTLKTFRIVALFGLMAVLTMGAITIRWFTDTPFTATPTASMVIELQSVSPNVYSYTRLSNLKTFMTENISSTNITVTNVTVNILSSQTNMFGGIIVTNGITNLSLTANTVVKSDANKTLASIANGTGALTNNNAGAFGWYAYFASLDDLMNASNSIVTQITNLSETVSNISTLDTLTVTNGLTNLSLTAKTQVQTDENKRLTSTPNGTGALTNDNAGNFGWYAYFASQDDLNTASNSILTLVTNLTTVVTNLDTLTVTNGITNLSLTANTVVKADANKQLASIANGTGALTNNNAGAFGWFNDFASHDELNSASNSILSQLTNTINTASNSILTQFTNTINSASNSILTQVTNLVGSVSNFTTIIVTNTATVNQLDYYTNAVATCDFSKGYGWTNVSAGFTFPDPINLPSPLSKASTCVVLVTNSSGSPIQIVQPANCHVVPNSVMWVTNVTSYTFFLYGNAMTNVYGIPLF